MPVLCSIKERIAGHLIIEKPLIYKYFYPYIYCISIAITRMSTFNHCFSSFIIAGSGDASSRPKRSIPLILSGTRASPLPVFTSFAIALPVTEKFLYSAMIVKPLLLYVKIIQNCYLIQICYIRYVQILCRR